MNRSQNSRALSAPARLGGMIQRGRAQARTSPLTVALRFFIFSGALALLAGPAAGVAQASPSNDAVPAITGNPWVGQTLTLEPGSWSDATSVVDQWEDCDAAGDVCAPIQNATDA